jgi:cbb3-type cytochrome oxidase maturation protein
MFVLLPAALLFAAAAVIVFAWATRSGQFDDLETPAVRILGDDDPPKPRDGDLPLGRATIEGP